MYCKQWLNENSYFCHFDRREKSVNPAISMVERFLDTLEMTVLLVFVQTLIYNLDKGMLFQAVDVLFF